MGRTVLPASSASVSSRCSRPSDALACPCQARLEAHAFVQAQCACMVSQMGPKGWVQLLQ